MWVVLGKTAGLAAGRLPYEHCFKGASTKSESGNRIKETMEASGRCPGLWLGRLLGSCETASCAKHSHRLSLDQKLGEA